MTAVMALVVTASAVAAVFLNDKGGNYRVVTDEAEVEADDILLFASYAKDDAEKASTLRIMTTLSAELDGKCGFYTYADYDYEANGMPKTLSVSNVNIDGYPYEYATGKQRSGTGLSLQNIDGEYLDTEEGSGNLIHASTTSRSKAWHFLKNVVYPEIINVSNSSSQKFLRCINEGEDAGSFVCCLVTENNPVYTYRKVFDVTIGNTGYSTFYNGNNDVKLPSGMKAFTYKRDGDMLVPSHTYNGDDGDILPHGTAVILRAAAGEYTLVVKHSQTECGEESLLSGTDENAVTISKYGDESCRYYVLTVGRNGLGFYYVNDNGAPFTNRAHKAYLCLPSAVAIQGVRFMLPLETPTAIKSIGIYDTPVHEEAEDKCYDLSGRKTSVSGDGIKIKHGRKFVQ